MADRINTPAEPPTAPSVTSLVGGIVQDIQQLVRQEIRLARTEMRQEWDKAKTAAGAMAVAAGLLGLGVLLLCLMFVYLINYFGLALWGCYGIVAGVLILCGLVVAGLAYARAKTVHVIPPQTAQTLKENVQWMQNQT
jgi:Flp pilus assembly protein TadB